MFEIPKAEDETVYYDGSQMFAWLADICGLSIDLVSKRQCSLYLYSLLLSSSSIHFSFSFNEMRFSPHVRDLNESCVNCGTS